MVSAGIGKEFAGNRRVIEHGEFVLANLAPFHRDSGVLVAHVIFAEVVLGEDLEHGLAACAAKGAAVMKNDTGVASLTAMNAARDFRHTW
jgi:hypothetical protein